MEDLAEQFGGAIEDEGDADVPARATARERLKNRGVIVSPKKKSAAAKKGAAVVAVTPKKAVDSAGAGQAPAPASPTSSKKNMARRQRVSS